MTCLRIWSWGVQGGGGEHVLWLHQHIEVKAHGINSGDHKEHCMLPVNMESNWVYSFTQTNCPVRVKDCCIAIPVAIELDN
jgi:hypothetical protein